MQTPRESGSPLLRQLTVTLAAAVCVLGTLVGTGVIGTRVAESSGGSLAADATLIAPAGPAFSIWSVIYLGLAAFVAWQWWGRTASSERYRRIAPLAAASMVLNAAWLLVTQVGWLEVSVAVIVALLVTCGVIVDRLADHPPTGRVEGVVVDGTFGLYLGWVCVAVCANIAATLVARGTPATGAGPTLATVAVLAVVVAVSGTLAARWGGNWYVAAGIAWGLVWVAAGRLRGEPLSPVVAVAAALAALTVLALTWRAGKPATGGR